MVTYKSLPEVDFLNSNSIETNFIVENNNELYRLNSESIIGNQNNITITINLAGQRDDEGEYGIIRFSQPNSTEEYIIYVGRRSSSISSGYDDIYEFSWSATIGDSTSVISLLSEWFDKIIESNNFKMTIIDSFYSVKGYANSCFIDNYGGLSFPLGAGYVRLSTNVKGGVQEPS